MFQILRRLTGSAGPPTSLRSGQFAVNFVDGNLYIGRGDDGSGVATSIEIIGGIGKFVTLVANQTIAGIKTFTSSPIVPDTAVNASSGAAVNTRSVRAMLDAMPTGGGTGTMSSQNANAVAITGGALSGVTITNSIIDGGTY